MWKRVITPILVVSLLWVTASFTTSHFIRRIVESHRRTTHEDFAAIESAWSMRRDLWKIQALAAQPGSLDSSQRRAMVRAVIQDFSASLANARQAAITSREQQLVSQISQQYDQYMKILGPALQSGQPIEPDRSEALVNAAATTGKELVELNQEQIRDQAVQDDLLYSRITTLRRCLLVIGPLTGIGLGLLVARQIRRSLSRIQVVLHDASGLLHPDVSPVYIQGDGDLPALQAQVEKVVQRMRDAAHELHQTRQDLLRAERLAAVGELSAGIAHEIRNPLTSVKLLIQMGAQHPDGPRFNQKQCQVVINQILRIEQTVQSLLDFSRPPAQQRVIHDLRETVAAVLSLHEGRIVQSGILLEQDLGPTKALVNADPGQFQTALGNLVINSIQAMAGGGVLYVQISATPSQVEVSLRDSGKGIPPHILPRLFEPFVTGKENGTGLGLPIAQRIIEEHGGTLSAGNHPYGGAEFRIVLPRCMAAVEHETGNSPAPPETVAVG